jgi:ABC-type transport system substrate-binding protein/uncharacterized membrane protein
MTIPVLGPGGRIGDLNLGDAVVILVGYRLGKAGGFIVGAGGSAFADILNGYFLFAVVTFIAKGLEGLCAGFQKQSSVVLAGSIMIASYFVGEGLYYSDWGFAKAMFPINAIQGLLGMIISLTIIKIIDHVQSRANRITFHKATYSEPLALVGGLLSLVFIKPTDLKGMLEGMQLYQLVDPMNAIVLVNMPTLLKLLMFLVLYFILVAVLLFSPLVLIRNTDKRSKALLQMGVILFMGVYLVSFFSDFRRIVIEKAQFIEQSTSPHEIKDVELYWHQFGKDGGILRLTGPVIDLNPYRTTNVYAHMLQSFLYRGLVKYKHTVDLSEGEKIVVPDLADVKPNDQYTEFRVTLKGNERFIQSSGDDENPLYSDLTVAEVRDSLLKTRNSSPLFNNITDIILNEQDPALDDHSLRIKLNTADPFFLYKLTLPQAFIVKSESSSEDGSYIGTGPFYVVGGAHDPTGIMLKRNPHFYQLYKGKPFLRGIYYHVTTDDKLRTDLFRLGHLDIVDLPQSSLSDVISNQSYQTHTQIREPLGLTYLVFGNNLTLCERRTIALAIDKLRIARTVQRPHMGDSIFPSALDGYKERHDFEYSPEKAKAELRDCRPISPTQLRRLRLLIKPGDEMQSVTAGIIKHNVEMVFNVGEGKNDIQWQVDVTPSQSYFSLGRKESTVQQSDFDMALMTWIVDYPSPENILDRFLRDFVGYKNEEIDKMLTSARGKRRADQPKLYQEAEKYVLRDLPLVALYSAKDTVIHNARVCGYHPHPLDKLRLDNLWVESIKR